MINYRWEFEQTEQQSIYTLSYCQSENDNWVQIAQITCRNTNQHEDDIERFAVYTTDIEEIRVNVIDMANMIFNEANNMIFSEVNNNGIETD